MEASQQRDMGTPTIRIVAVALLVLGSLAVAPYWWLHTWVPWTLAVGLSLVAVACGLALCGCSRHSARHRDDRRLWTIFWGVQLIHCVPVAALATSVVWCIRPRPDDPLLALGWITTPVLFWAALLVLVRALEPRRERWGVAAVCTMAALHGNPASWLLFMTPWLAID